MIFKNGRGISLSIVFGIHPGSEQDRRNLFFVEGSMIGCHRFLSHDTRQHRLKRTGKFRNQVIDILIGRRLGIEPAGWKSEHIEVDTGVNLDSVAERTVEKIP